MFPNPVANDYKSHVVVKGVVTFWLISTSGNHLAFSGYLFSWNCLKHLVVVRHFLITNLKKWQKTPSSRQAFSLLTFSGVSNKCLATTRHFLGSLLINDPKNTWQLPSIFIHSHY
jgi:hypothetical protein